MDPVTSESDELREGEITLSSVNGHPGSIVTIYGENITPHVVMGMAMVNGATPAAGTEITAHAGAMEVGSAMVKAGGTFRVDEKNPSRLSLCPAAKPA